ncbi:nucleoside deaminase [Streptomyces mangrovi]|uniref:nucleoside deaminase n=1 Tax=Streptomyces mangrovi TaxID=1206892 RepID=UPI00399C735D
MTDREVDAGMLRCLRLAREAALSGNYGLGAVVIRDGAVLGESGSGLVQGHDPTAHPEVQAIRRAAERVGSRYLAGAFLLTTLEPCPMCTAAAIWAKMRGIAFGATQEDARSWAAEHPDETFTWRQIDLRARDVVRAGYPRLEVREGVRRDECLELFPLTARKAARQAPVGGAAGRR